MTTDETITDTDTNTDTADASGVSDDMEREYATTSAFAAASIFLQWATVTGDTERWIVNNHFGPERAGHFRAALEDIIRRLIDEALTRADQGLMDLSRSEPDWAELRAKFDADLRARVSRFPDGRGRPRKAATAKAKGTTSDHGTV